MFNWKIAAETTIKADPRHVWNIWTDVASWPKWDHELEWSIINGPFKVGTEGELKPKGWPKSKFRLIAVEEGRSHSDRTTMPFTTVLFHHTLTKCEDSYVRIVHTVEVSGLLAPILWLTMRMALKKGLPQAVDRLGKLAELKTSE